MFIVLIITISSSYPIYIYIFGHLNEDTLWEPIQLKSWLQYWFFKVACIIQVSWTYWESVQTLAKTQTELSSKKSGGISLTF